MIFKKILSLGLRIKKRKNSLTVIIIVKELHIGSEEEDNK